MVVGGGGSGGRGWFRGRGRVVGVRGDRVVGSRRWLGLGSRCGEM